jgi:hypothetical protein
VWTGYACLRIGTGGNETSDCIKFTTILTSCATVSYSRGTLHHCDDAYFRKDDHLTQKQNPIYPFITVQDRHHFVFI